MDSHYLESHYLDSHYPGFEGGKKSGHASAVRVSQTNRYSLSAEIYAFDFAAGAEKLPRPCFSQPNRIL